MTDPVPPRLYVYRCYDASPIVAWISRVVAPPIQRRMPRAVSANQVTVFGSMLLWLALAGALLTPLDWRRALAPLWVLLMWSYCVLDHVDGLHARATGSSSALGEYLDHALDAWNVSVVIGLTAALSVGATTGIGVVALAGAGAFAAVVTWLDQLEHGCIRLGRAGPVEGVLLAGLFLLTWELPGAPAWWAGAATDALTRADVAFLLSGVVTLASTFGAVRRMGRLRWRAALVAVQLIVAGGIVQVVPATWIPMAVVTAAMAAVYSGRVIAAHLAGAVAPLPDCIAVPIAVTLLGAVRTGLSAVWLWIPATWLAFVGLREIACTYRQLAAQVAASRTSRPQLVTLVSS